MAEREQQLGECALWTRQFDRVRFIIAIGTHSLKAAFARSGTDSFGWLSDATIVIAKHLPIIRKHRLFVYF